MADAGGSRVCGKTVLEEEEGGERRRGVLGGRMKTSSEIGWFEAKTLDTPWS